MPHDLYRLASDHAFHMFYEPAMFWPFTWSTDGSTGFPMEVETKEPNQNIDSKALFETTLFDGCRQRQYESREGLKSMNRGNNFASPDTRLVSGTISKLFVCHCTWQKTYNLWCSPLLFMSLFQAAMAWKKRMLIFYGLCFALKPVLPLCIKLSVFLQ